MERINFDPSWLTIPQQSINIPGFTPGAPPAGQYYGTMSNFITHQSIVQSDYGTSDKILKQLETVRITGKITNTKYKPEVKGYEITIFSENYSGLITVLSVYPIKPLKGDSICGDISFYNNQYLFVDEPMIEPVADKQSIESLFDIALKGIFFNEKMRTRLYDFFLQETYKQVDINPRVGSALYRTRESIDSQVIETINMYAENYLLDQESTITALKNNTPLEEKGIKRLMWWWSKNYLYRRLYMLGVTRTEIRGCVDRGWTLRDLYYQLLENPYILEKVNLDTCNKITKKYDKIFPSEVLQCGHLVRDIDDQCTSNSWMCMPINYIIKRYPSLLPSVNSDGLLPTLKNNFKCHIRYNCIYLAHQADTEDTLTMYLESTGAIPEMAPSREIMLSLNEKQRESLCMALSNHISIITGGPGTGKTTVISSLVEELARRNISYVISAFTGKAIARLKQVIKRKTTNYDLEHAN